MMTYSQLEKACRSHQQYLTDENMIKNAIIAMAELDVNELYKDGRFDREKTVSQIRTMCNFSPEETDTLGKLIERLIRFKDYIDSIDDAVALEAIEQGLFDYDPDPEEEYYIGPPGDEYQSECLWAYYEAMHLLSYIHMGFCVNTLKREE